MSQQVAILGAGESGLAARELVRSFGGSGRVFDQAGRGDCDSFSDGDARRADAIVVSPGFAAGHPWRRIAEASETPVCGELAFAARHWRGSLLGVTGTNGKTSVTSLLRAALESAGRKAVEAGNIGEALSRFAAGSANTSDCVAVCEISSFQAELPDGLALDGLLWTNFAEDHLDRYAGVREYFHAKARLTQCLKAEAPFVAGPGVAEWAEAFGWGGFRERGGQWPEGTAVCPEVCGGSVFQRPPQSGNFRLAAEFWDALGLPPEALRAAADSFRPHPHRLALVAEFGGVRFWDDSKATNFDAALAAVAGMERPVYWIGGGRPKGGDIGAFAASLAGRIEAAFVYGEAAAELGPSLRARHPGVEIVVSFQDAVRSAVEQACAGAPADVLLSPAFASFDQFANYAERGKSFLATVLGLKPNLCFG